MGQADKSTKYRSPGLTAIFYSIVEYDPEKIRWVYNLPNDYDYIFYVTAAANDFCNSDEGWDGKEPIEIVIHASEFGPPTHRFIFTYAGESAIVCPLYQHLHYYDNGHDLLDLIKNVYQETKMGEENFELNGPRLIIQCNGDLVLSSVSGGKSSVVCWSELNDCQIEHFANEFKRDLHSRVGLARAKNSRKITKSSDLIDEGKKVAGAVDHTGGGIC